MPENQPESGDIIQNSIGVLGRWHIAMCALIFPVKFPVAWHQVSIVFLAPPVKFHCVDNQTDKCASNCTRHVFERSLFTETIITQWDLVCEKSYLAGLSQTIMMLGILFGSIIFGYLADRFGRRKPLIWGSLLQLVAGAVTAVVPWYAVFSIMRFLVGLATGGTMVISFVMIMEIIGIKWRTVAGLFYQIPFNVGHLLLPLFAYCLRDWRHLQLLISLPSIFFILYCWLLPESPRWLLSVGRKEEAVKILETAARHNKRPTENIENNVNAYLQSRETGQKKKGGNMIDLFRTRIMSIYTCCLGFNWFTGGFCFYGTAQYIGQLGGNIFINVALSAIIQIPSVFYSIWSLKALGRKWTLISSNLVAGICCLAMPVVPKDLTWVTTVLSCVAMFALTTQFNTIYIYSGELFPTVLRNVGLGTSSMCARIGSMVAPLIVQLIIYQDWLPPVIFGIIPVIAALFAMLLPETLNCVLPNTVEEAEKFAKRGRRRDDTEMSPQTN